MNHEKMFGEFDSQLSSFNKKGLGLLLKTILSPLTTATEPLFRKKLGERYFHLGSVVGGCGLWVLAIGFGHFNGSLFLVYAAIYGGKLGDFLRLHDGNLWLGIPIFALFFLLGGYECWKTRGRKQTGELWHSMSRGESRFGSENAVRDGIIKLALGLVLIFFATMLGIVFFASWFLRAQFSELERKRAYGRYLDAVDAQIENSFLLGAMLNGTPPGENYGIHGPLPKVFTGKYRENVARAGAGAELKLDFDGQQPAREAALSRQTPVIVHATPQKGGATASSLLVPQPPAQTESQLTAWQQQQFTKQSAARAWIENLISKLMANSYRIFGFAVVLVFSFFVAGSTIYYFTKAKDPLPVRAPVVATTKVKPPKTNSLAVPEVVVPVAPTQKIQVVAPEPSPVVAAPAEPKPEVKAEEAAMAAKAVAVAEKARVDEALLGKIKSLIEGEADKIAKFKTDGETKLADNVVQIKAVSFFRRGNLTKANNTSKTQFEVLLADQEKAIAPIRAELPFIGQPQHLTPQDFLPQFESFLSAREKKRQVVLLGIEEVTSGIMKKPAQHGLD